MSGFLGAAYDWVKAAHLIFVIFWMAGLFMLPRYLVYHQEALAAGNAAEAASWIEREGKIRKIILTPAMIVVWVLGLALALNLGLADGAPGLGWLHLKLLLVFLLTGYHGWTVGYAKKLAVMERHSGGGGDGVAFGEQLFFTVERPRGQRIMTMSITCERTFDPAELEDLPVMSTRLIPNAEPDSPPSVAQLVRLDVEAPMHKSADGTPMLFTGRASVSMDARSEVDPWHRHDEVVVEARPPGLVGEAVRAGGEGVLSLARDVVTLPQLLGRLAERVVARRAGGRGARQGALQAQLHGHVRRRHVGDDPGDEQGRGAVGAPPVDDQRLRDEAG